jgi:hypothetical protein
MVTTMQLIDSGKSYGVTHCLWCGAELKKPTTKPDRYCSLECWQEAEYGDDRD